MSKHDTRPFIERAREVHGDHYDYTNTVYVTSHTPVTFTCNIHQCECTATPSDHLRSGCGCKLCRYDKAIASRTGGTSRWSTQQFVDKAKEVHGDRYDYSHVTYTNAHTYVTIVCKEHGPWDTRPTDHIRGNGGVGLGCPICTHKMSAPERVIHRTLTELGVDFFYQHPTLIRSDKGRVLWYDFFIPSTNTVIEYDGRQHTDENWVTGLERRQLLDGLKNEDATSRGYTMVRIPYSYTGKRLAAYIKQLPLIRCQCQH